MEILKVNNIRKTFDNSSIEIEVLKGISFDVYENDFILLTGPSGSGKTTLLNVISGLDMPTSGNVIINNKDISKLSNKEISLFRQKEIGYVFQNYNLISDLTVFDNIKIANAIAGIENDSLIYELLEKFGLAKYKDYLPEKLSGGMQQRVSIIRAIINNPNIIFADEPTGNLDSSSSRIVMEMLKELNVKYNKTIIMVTHSLDNLKYGTRNIQIVDGQIKEDIKL